MMGASRGVIDEGSGSTAALIGGNASILYLFRSMRRFAGGRRAGGAAYCWLWPTASTWCWTLLHLWPRAISGAGRVTGAAVATTIGRGAGCAYPFWYLFAGRAASSSGAQPGAFAVFDRTPGPGFHRRHRSVLDRGQSSWILVIRIIAMWVAPGGGLHHRHPHDRACFSPRLGLGNAAVMCTNS